MPVLGRRKTTELVRTGIAEGRASGVENSLPAWYPRSTRRGGLLEACANPACDSGWLHLWRSHSAPIFEHGWSCSPVCSEALVDAALRRELDARVAGDAGYRHRIPLGLVMLEQGWINTTQLRHALDSQKSAGVGRVGQWLVRQQGVSEQFVTRALGLQWSCPVLGLEFHDPQALAPLVPRFFLDAFGALPLRVAAGKVLYLGFQERLDPVLTLAVERMTGLRAESGLVRESEFGPAHTRMLGAEFPEVELVESSSSPVAARVLARAIEHARPVESRLVRVHDCLWLRMWRHKQMGPVADIDSVRDLICSVGARS
jgi:hypothetical protein